MLLGNINVNTELRALPYLQAVAGGIYFWTYQLLVGERTGRMCWLGVLLNQQRHSCCPLLCAAYERIRLTIDCPGRALCQSRPCSKALAGRVQTRAHGIEQAPWIWMHQHHAAAPR